MRISIDSSGVTIECADANVSVREVAAEALALWKETTATRTGTEGPAYGFSNDRSDGQVSPFSLSYGHYVTEPRASEGGAD